MGRGASIRVGERATLRMSGRPVEVRVVEDRGALGPSRSRLLRLGIVGDDLTEEPRELELAEAAFDGLLVDEST